MIKSLRIRFIAISMSMISVVLLVTFTVLILISARNFKEESLIALDTHYEAQFNTSRNVNSEPQKPDGFVVEKPLGDTMPFYTFFIVINDDESIQVMFDRNKQVTDEMALFIVESIRDDDKNQGRIESLNLRFKVYDNKTFGLINDTFASQFIEDQITSYTEAALE